MSNEVVIFDYDQLDGSTAEFLRNKETNMREIVGKAYTELGRELKEARDRLAGNNQYDGVFRKWLDSIGFKKDKALDLMRRYELVVGNSDKQTSEMLEDLPVSLAYEIAKPSAESTESKRQAKQAVLSGEVKTLKEYRELEKALRQANEDKQILGQLLTEERNKPLEVELLRMVLGFELNLTGKIYAVPFVPITERPENRRPRETRSLLSYNSKKGGDYYK